MGVKSPRTMSEQKKAQKLINPEKAVEVLDIVARRYSYYLGKRMVLRRMMLETVSERLRVQQLGRRLHEAIENYIQKPTNELRNTIMSLRKELSEAKAVLRDRQKPYWDVIRPLNMALSYLDKTVIPQKLREVGYDITPVETPEPRDLPQIKPKIPKKAQK